MPLEVQGHTVPHLKALISGKMEPRGLRCSSLFILCQTLWKNTSLLHKMRFVWLVLATTVVFIENSRTNLDLVVHELGWDGFQVPFLWKILFCKFHMYVALTNCNVRINVWPIIQHPLNQGNSGYVRIVYLPYYHYYRAIRHSSQVFDPNFDPLKVGFLRKVLYWIFCRMLLLEKLC